MKKIISVNTSSFGVFDSSPLKMLKDSGYEVLQNPFNRKLDVKETIDLCQKVDGVIAGTELFSKEVIQALPRLKVISRCGVGMDNVDLKAASSAQIQVMNTPDAPTQAVAELTVSLILSLLRHVVPVHNNLVQGKWEKEMGFLLEGKMVGIIGFGRIGQRVAALLKVFGVKLVYFDLQDKNIDMSITRMDLDDLLSHADIVSLHISQVGSSSLFDRDTLLKMKKGSWLCNMSRGGVVDEAALCDLLKSGYIQGAALDVFENEPYQGPLSGLPNVILTPHIGSYAREARIRMETEAVNNLMQCFDSK